MKICVMTLSYNCAEMVPFFLRHYERFADKILVWDDQSTDGTRALWEAHPLVEVRPWERERGIHEDVFLLHWYTEYPLLAGRFDWVMVPDVDEFLVTEDGEGGWLVLEVLEKAMAAGYEVIQASGFNLLGEKFPVDEGWQIYEVNPMGVAAPVYNKPIVFRPETTIRWMRGKHQLEHCAPRVSPPLLKLLHARYFGADYTRRRNARNYERLGDDKGAGWSVAPEYDGEQLEGSPTWAEWARTKQFNVLEAKL